MREATLQSKRASYNVALQNGRNLRASIQASEATMKLAGRQVRDTDIRAPFDGYVERRMVNLGELVKTQVPVMTVVRLDPLKVTAEIPEKMAPWIEQGQPVDAAGGRLSGPDLHRQGLAHQPRREYRRRAPSRSKRWCRTTTRS